MAAVTIAEMTAADIPAVYALELICFTAPWTMEAYLDELENPTSFYFTAKIDGEVVGFGGMWAIVDEAHIVTLATSPAHRRHGIGRQLLTALMAMAAQLDIKEITLEVRIGNTPARNLYESFGFQSLAIRKNYYPDNGEDGVIMGVKVG